jgi:hypothetical protein
MDKEELLINELKKELQIDLAEKISFEEIQKKLEANINFLITHDFEKLISLLYRIDVNEAKLKNILKENKDQDASKLIAGLIIERQLQKIKTRSEFSQKKNDNDDGKW